MMRVKHSILMMGGVLASMLVLPAHAATLDRHYHNGGTFFVLAGEIRPAFTKRIETSHYFGDNRRAFDGMIPPTFTYQRGTVEDVLASKNKALNDERLRLRGVDGNYISAFVRQDLNRKLRIDGVLAFNHLMSSNRSFFAGDIGLSHVDGLGSITLSANSQLPTSHPATSSTYYTLDTAAGSAISARYTQIPNLTVSGYYAFTAPRYMYDQGLKRGYGATVRYRHAFAPRNTLTVSAGYSHGQRRDEMSGDNNWTHKERQATQAGFSYNYYDWTLSADTGVAKADYDGTVIKDAKIKNAGVRLGYNFSPRFSTHAYYGEQVTKSNEADGVNLDFATLRRAVLNESPTGGRVIDERQLFKKIKAKTYGVGARYAYSNNLSFNASAGYDNTTYSLTDGDFLRLKNQSYTVGLSYSF